ncbi:hypothetical protein BD626DRAFT_585532 [Schizophyllum amplum]|uniref:Uncharacterized protein n=1 Tax=Schizophyllum amplum TaxID=97359 RepID=A0A550C4A6_9AGAR|nr:hypothetical protein BD626DRAFT_585532 [Auriculariopsis ampla]
MDVNFQISAREVLRTFSTTMGRQRRHAHAQGLFRGALPRLQHHAIHLENRHPPVQAGAILGTIWTLDCTRSEVVSSKIRAGDFATGWGSTPGTWCASREAIEIRPASGIGASAFAPAVELDGRPRRTRQPNPTFLKSDSPYSKSDPYTTADPAILEARSRCT